MNIEVLGLLALIVGPTAFWAAYHLYKDRIRPEPPLFLLLSYALGLVGGYLASQGYALLEVFGLRQDAFALAADGHLDRLLVYSVLGIGVIEELAKFLPFWLVAIRHHHFDEPIDGIIYASFVALGFASYENSIYLSFLSGWDALGRSVASPLVHVMFASIWGYSCGRALVDQRSPIAGIVVGLAAAIVAHGLYDFLVIGYPDLAPFAAMIIAAIWVWRMHLIRRLNAAHKTANSMD